MARRGARIVKAVAALITILIAVFFVLWLLMCFTTFISSFLRSLLLTFNDEAPSPGSTDEVQDSDLEGAIEGEEEGLDKTAIDNLPIVIFHEKTGAEGEATTDDDGKGGKLRTLNLDCGICLSDFQESECLRLLPGCQHCFHAPCIEAWLSSHSTCPLCRRSLRRHPAVIHVVNIGSGSPPISRS
ncbi:hypothetical protein KP509_15G012300 [Ceratopteris richardii]|uniref:RING-type E3 ubiquitin transferase n=1 Tax=Ceratopteris richardii TaxID=49495 RepID=A0A8T2T202_CERRI|nr:hypothetical protein KP509_15G012300 [Ceratopteris richardii]